MLRAGEPLLIIDPSTTRADPTAAGVEMIRQVWGGDARVLSPALVGDGPREDTGYEFAAVVLMGSRASVHDELAWARELSDWLGPILSGQVSMPLLGICYGHQLIAHAAGGEVGFVTPEQTKLFGIGTSRLDCRFLQAADLRVVVSHKEEVKRLPAGFHPCSRREGILYDGMEHDTLPIWSLQFHPEADASFLRERGVPVSHEEEALVHADSVRLLGAFMKAGRTSH